MRYLLMVVVLGALVGCEKTIHEARGPLPVSPVTAYG